MSQIYLISPPKIELKQFERDLQIALKTQSIPAFQLRLKGYDYLTLEKISKSIKKICHDHNCLFLLNDFWQLAIDINADGVHLGAEDGSIKALRSQVSDKFVIGASCYDSKHLAMEAGEQGADYISFGAFFESKTKKSRGNPDVDIVKWCDEIINLPICAIGGITDQNCAKLVAAKTDFLAVISYVWNNPVGIKQAIENLNRAIEVAKITEF